MSSPISRQVIGSKASINPVIRSTVKFRWDFKKSLTGLMEKVELIIEEKVGSLYTLHSIINSSSKIKVRISDETTGIECIISCIFEYNHTDVSYGNVHIELMIMEVSKKPRSVLLDKYSVLDQERVCDDVTEGIVGILRKL